MTETVISKTGVPNFDREKCVHCDACLWNCASASSETRAHGRRLPRRQRRPALGRFPVYRLGALVDPDAPAGKRLRNCRPIRPGAGRRYRHTSNGPASPQVPVEVQRFRQRMFTSRPDAELAGFPCSDWSPPTPDQPPTVRPGVPPASLAQARFPLGEVVASGPPTCAAAR